MSVKKYNKKHSLLLLLLGIFVSTLSVSFAKSVFPQLSPTIKAVEAQTVAIPSPYCLGSCPTTALSQSPSASAMTPTLTMGPTSTETNSTPLPTQSTTPSPTTAQPCESAETVSIQHNKEKKNKHKKKHRGGQSGGFLEALIRFIFQLILLILEKAGINIPNMPGAGGEPCAEVTPSESPTPSTEVTETPSVTTEPSHSVTPSTSAAPSNSTSDIPAQILNLTNWKLTLPIGSSGSPTEIKQTQLATYKHDPYFVVLNGAVRFRAPVNGVTTDGSSYPRSELREMSNNGTTNAAWSTSSGTHTMTIEEAITAVPATKKHVVAGQIHDSEDDVIVIRLEDKKLFIDIGGSDGPTLDANYTLGKKFTVKFEVKDGKTSIYYNNASTPAHTLTKSYSGAYFKAGAYTQSNCSTETSGPCSGNNYGEVIIYKLEVTHQ